MKKLLIGLSIVLLSGCSTIESVKKYFPRDHDPIMFSHLVSLSIAVDNVNCEKPDWTNAIEASKYLSKYAEWRKDPQQENLLGLYKHIEKMGTGGSKVFCELGKKTSTQRINAARSAWENR